MDQSLQNQVIRQIRKSEGDKILLILDGYDELRSRASKDSLYLKIIKSDVLRRSTVIITSRQHASDSLLKQGYIDHHVEVVGFTEADIKNSITASIADKSKAAELCQLLQQRQDLACLCYIPLVCASVVHLYMEDGYNLPRTLTDLYSKLVINLARRNAKRWKDASLSKRITSLMDLPQPTSHWFKLLSEMAYLNLAREDPKLIFDEEDLEQMPFPSSEVETYTLGLMTTVISYSSHDNRENYQFLHATLQEFLAAWWIATMLTDEEQAAFFYDNQHNDQLRLVLVFLAGISELRAEQYSRVFQCKIDFTNKTDFGYLQFYNNPEEEKQLTPVNYHLEAQRFLLLLLYLHEAKNKNMCHTLAESIAKSTIDLQRTRLTLFHCMALGHFLSNSVCSWKALNLPFHGLSDRSIIALCSCLSTKGDYPSKGGEITETGNSKVQQLTFTSSATNYPVKLNDFSQSALQNIVDKEIFDNCKVIRLCYGYSPKGDDDEDALANLLSHLPNLESLYISRELSEPDTNYQTFIRFGRDMKTAKSLRVLTLYKCGLDSYAVQFLADALKESTAVEELNLCYNNITGEGSLHLFNALTTNCTVKCLDLTDNAGLTEVPFAVPNPSIEALERMISDNTNLENLKFDGCGLAGTAVEAIARGLTHNRTLRHLSMGIYMDVETGEIAAPASVGLLAAVNLFKALQVNSVLKRLSFSFQFDQQMKYNKVLGDSIECMISHNKSLECLSIALFNDESPAELYDRLTYFEMAIARGVQQNSVLAELCVYGQFFTPTACGELFSALKCNHSLKKLCIDVANDGNVDKALIDMLLCNTSLNVLDLCHFIHILRDARTEPIIPGLELPKHMKTDREEPNFKPFVQAGLNEADKRFKVFDEIDKVNDEFIQQGLLKDSSEPVPQSMYGSFAVMPPASKGIIPRLHPRNIFSTDACVNIITALQSNYSIAELHLPCSFNENGTLRLVHKALLKTVSCNPSLTLLKVHSDGNPLEQRHFAEFFEVYRKEAENSQLKMKRFGRGQAGTRLQAPPGTLIFERNWTERF